MKKYYALACLDTIESVEVLRETAESVVLMNGRKARKRTESSQYCDTFEEAKQFLKARAECEIHNMEARIERQRVRLERIEAMEESK